MRPSDLKCSSGNLFYLLTSETSSKQYRGSTEDFWPMFNNYRSSHRNVLKRKKMLNKSLFSFCGGFF